MRRQGLTEFHALNPMIDNFAIALVLVLTAAIALLVRGRGKAIRLWLSGFISVTVALGNPGNWRDSWRNPLLRLLVLLLALIVAGWVATLSQVGFEQVKRMVNFERLPPQRATVGRYQAQETANCHLVQQMAVQDIPRWAESKHIHLRPGPIDPRYDWNCQFGGNYSFDESGVLFCSLHGRAQGNPALFDASAEEK